MSLGTEIGPPLSFTPASSKRSLGGWFSRRKLVTRMLPGIIAAGALRGRVKAVDEEGRALWVNRFEYASAGDIAQIMADAGRANFNVVYFQVRGAGDAFYQSEIEPCAVSLCGELGGDPPYDALGVAVEEAAKHGIEVHAWLNALSSWPSGNADVCALLTESPDGQPRHMLLDHPDWAVVDRAGRPLRCPNSEEYVYLSPAFPGVREQLARVAADVASRYDIHGIHLDRIRYPGQEWSYDDASLEAFGRDPESDPAAWDQFRRDQVNATVHDTYEAMTAVDPALVLSAAVWPIYQNHWTWRSSEGYSWYFQDPRAWTADGYLDVAVPMTYDPITSDQCGLADWRCLLDDHLEGIQVAIGRHVYIGVNARNGADEVLREIEVGRERGVTGFALYSYRQLDGVGLWDRLAEGPFREPAAVPPRPWKRTGPIVGDGTGGPEGTPTPSPR